MKRQNDFLVGMVVLVAAAVVTGMALFLSRAQLGPKRAAVVARVRDVGGAKVGAQVVIRGVEAGRISSMVLDEKDGWVELHITLAKGVTLPRDPVLILSEASMFGQWEATLQERSSTPPNPDVQDQLDDPGARRGGAIPGATLPDLGQLAVVASRIAGDVEAVAQRFGTAFNDTAARELRATIRNVNTLTGTLNGAVQRESKNLDQLIANLNSTVASIDTSAEAIQRTAMRVDSSTSRGQVKELVTNLNLASADLREMAAQLKKSASSVTRTASSFESMVGHTDSVMVKIDRGQGTLGLIVNDPRLYRDADSLLVTLRALAADLKAHPSRYVNVKVF